MKLPSLFHGRYRGVKRRMNTIVTQIRRGNDWIAAVEAEGFVDTESTPGLIVMDGPGPLPGGGRHFQMWLLWSQLWCKVDDDPLIQKVFEQSLTRAWSVLGLVADGNHDWLIPRARLRPFLRVIRHHWSTFADVGPRYSNGSDEGDDLWSHSNNVKHTLDKLGISTKTLLSPLPPGGLDELIDETERHLH